MLQINFLGQFKHSLRIIFLGLIAFLSTTNVFAEDTSKEFWPEVDLWWKATPDLRFSSFLPFTQNVESYYREGSFIAQADYSWGETKKIFFMRLLDSAAAEKIKSNMIRGGYLTGKSLDDKGENYSEKTVFGEYHFRVPVKGRFLFTQRLRSDFRWLGADNDYSYRLRYRWMVEREFTGKEISYVPYVNIEPYYDSRYDSVTRMRLIGGSLFTWSKRYALEGNITYQYDSHSSVTNLYAFAAILHLYIMQ